MIFALDFGGVLRTDWKDQVIGIAARHGSIVDVTKAQFPKPGMVICPIIDTIENYQKHVYEQSCKKEKS